MAGRGGEAVCLHSRGQELAVLLLNYHKLQEHRNEMKVTRSPPCIVKRELFIFPILFYCDTSPPYLSSQHLSKGDKAWISSGFLYVNSSCVFAKTIIERGLSLDPISIQDSRSAHLLAVFFIFIMFIFLCVLKKTTLL